MKRKKRRLRRKIKKAVFFIASLCFSFSLLTLTFAVDESYLWLLVDDEIENVLSLPYYQVSIIEDFPKVEDWVPGTAATKKVQFSNRGNADVIIRCTYLEYWHNDKTLSNTFDHDGIPSTQEVDTVTKQWTNYWADGNGSEWVNGNDGYYYYTKVLKAGDTTKPILNSLTMHGDLPSIYAQEKYILTFKVEALIVSSDSNAIYELWKKRPQIENESTVRW
ncbi:alternate signal-mediated exported protein [Breznakia sp. PF5-3]|uniref:BsaA family SipW-dependent biofilm matrix protein n=1 Tax=unclassified Breznakia TaxID=2623764 RepID=UPI002406D4B2|nr:MULTISPECIES: BsaA family SipW-dependent biofilm matrix protein [unclassified Breznakia]MDL2276254.1 BsaA family SipW-dependent biofilm matrix protein [Breznakia sp. OttesenSCG-928-G09]MDF9824912.1 alternate signal-mediated exported protein [Breznakia sp. PM6-1]MDF9835589.1 alternate signal-mediated exported protein [Breznakia sp. PF5-3]MDF9837995.1 alternate signal-mediated exported protein [Breznakia sp. PFB2-8]MDF9859984.1 alternate signal-mediated exported protein [Breznakia sp. PH5-24]